MSLHALTIDVEDYFQVSAFEDNVKVEQWGQYESRVERNTHKILDLFDENNVSGTFFTLGWVAKKYPKLVEEIAKRGHEVASHGYSHKLIYKQSQNVFRQETIASKKILEDTAQMPIKGYRAASYSITKNSLWALDILAEAGFEYDSSVFPVRHDRYGIPSSPVEPYIIETEKGNRIKEYPLSTANIGSIRLPVAGGGYFRLYPFWFFKWLVNRSIKQHNSSYIFYLHPWEVDPDQPKIDASFVSTFRHYNNLDKCEVRLSKFLKLFDFSTVENVLKNTEMGLCKTAEL